MQNGFWRCYQKTEPLAELPSKGDRSTLKDVNKFVREISQKEVELTVYKLKAESDEDLVLVGWSDAALANRVYRSSTGGSSLVLFTSAWLIKVNKDVCWSSLAAEGQALAECKSELMLIRVLWQELLGRQFNMTSPWSCAKLISSILVIDAETLYDILMQKNMT